MKCIILVIDCLLLPWM
jgi:hypothetical protein